MAGLQQEMDDLLTRFFGSTWPAAGKAEAEDAAAPRWLPAVESFVADGKLGVRVALPGVDPKDVEVTVTDDVLTVRGDRKAAVQRNQGSYYLREFTHGGFERHLALPAGVDPGQVTARYVNGVLEISMPAPMTVAPKRVEIQVEQPSDSPREVKVPRGA